MKSGGCYGRRTSVRDALATSIGLAFFLGAYTTSALAALVAWWMLRRVVGGWRPATRAQFCFALRVAPIVLALAGLGVLIIPAWLAYEPIRTSEGIGWPLVATAILTTGCVATAVINLVRSMLATQRTLTAWRHGATPVRIEGIDSEVFRIDHWFPLLATVGIQRPRIFIAAQVLAALETREVRAAIQHELAHQHRRDNLKTAVMRFCRDLLPIASGLRSIDHAFAAAAEQAADEESVTQQSSSIDLASALVKIGRLVPYGATINMAATAFIVDGGGDLAARIRRLSSADTMIAVPTSSRRLVISVFVVASIVAYAIAAQRALLVVHTIIEQLVRLTS